MCTYVKFPASIRAASTFCVFSYTILSLRCLTNDAFPLHEPCAGDGVHQKAIRSTSTPCTLPPAPHLTTPIENSNAITSMSVQSIATPSAKAARPTYSIRPGSTDPRRSRLNEFYETPFVLSKWTIVARIYGSTCTTARRNTRIRSSPKEPGTYVIYLPRSEPLPRVASNIDTHFTDSHIYNSHFIYSYPIDLHLIPEYLAKVVRSPEPIPHS